MPRHHNRAILSAITEQNLNPTKEYVDGKNGLTLSSKELKKLSTPQQQLTASDVSEVVISSIEETKHEVQQTIEPSVDLHNEDILEKDEQLSLKEETTSVDSETAVDKSTKFKKKTVVKKNNVVDQ